jgi:hypothetical protein
MADSLILKIGESGLDIPAHLSETMQRRVVLVYFDLAKKQDSLDQEIQQLYANPRISNPGQASSDKVRQRKQNQILLEQLAPVVEEILQRQVTEVLTMERIDLGGQSIPPVLFHFTPLPKALIISPRDTIRQDANISLLADFSLDQTIQLENDVAKNLGVSALVVDIGGVGVYPTMVMRSSDLSWVIQTIAHEWTHNYLSLHPLGLNYETNNELRTMNETTASIVGEEISQKVIARFYPELSSSIIRSAPLSLAAAGNFQDENTFDFNSEMHLTRVTVDKLLKEGRIAEAESYMEARRQVFVDHGYLIRKLNQAYFAFYGAYANTPEGAAGQDPVGPAVRGLRSQSATLSDFLKQIAWMNSFSDLQSKLGQSK